MKIALMNNWRNSKDQLNGFLNAIKVYKIICLKSRVYNCLARRIKLA